jgi:hypothetical protein
MDSYVSKSHSYFWQVGLLWVLWIEEIEKNSNLSRMLSCLKTGNKFNLLGQNNRSCSVF